MTLPAWLHNVLPDWILAQLDALAVPALSLIHV